MSMKKNFLALVVSLLCCVMTAFAADEFSGAYFGSLSMGDTDLGRNTVFIHPGSSDDRVVFVLPDFNFLGQLPVGDIVLVDVAVADSVLSLDSYPLYLQALPSLVYISMADGSAFRGDSLVADLSIDIPGLGAVLVSFKGSHRTDGYQVYNGGFEEWEMDSSDIKKGLKGMEPVHWNSFVTASTNPAPEMVGLESLLQMALNNEQLKDSVIARPGSAGSRSALVTSKSTFGIAANGNLTTGRINAGSIDVKSPYNSNISSPAADDRFKVPFYGAPDSLSVWVKYRPADGNIDTAVNMAGIKAIIHNNGVYQDPEDSIMRVDTTFAQIDDVLTDTILDTTIMVKYDSVKVAQAITSYRAVEGYGWQRISIPFEYFDNEHTPKDSAQYILVSFSTNVAPGGGTTSGNFFGTTAADSIFIDDLNLIYNRARLTSLKVGDEEVALVDGTYEYTVKQPFNDSTLVLTTEIEGAEGASAVCAFNRSAQKAIVIVKGGDYAVNPSNVQYYTISFTAPVVGVDDVYGDDAVVYTNGRVVYIESDVVAEVSIFSVDGRLIGTTVASTYTLPHAGVYFVRVGGVTHKVVSR